MPLVSVEDVKPDARLGLWSMTDAMDESGELYRQAAALYKSASRRREYVSVRMLLAAMIDYPCPELSHDSNGRPRLDNHLNISISHTRGACAVIVSRKHDVAVDVEYISERVNRIASMFLRGDEKADDVESRLLHWCAKETVYKLFSDDNLTFEDMQITALRRHLVAPIANSGYCGRADLRSQPGPFAADKGYIPGSISVAQRRRGITIDVSSRIYPEHILTFAVL